MTNHIRQIGFKVLMATQFLGAFNDNAFKLVIAFLAIDRFAQEEGGSLFLSLTGAVFIVPFLLFSSFAGFLADRFSKQKILVGAKVGELFVMVLGLWALWQGNIWFILLVLFIMGLQSTFFSPSKYGILPEILEERELSEGNGIIMMWTYAAIILGQACGGLLVHVFSPDLYKTSFVFVGVSLMGITTSFYIEKVKASGARRKLQWNFLQEHYQNIKWIRKDRALFLSIIGLAYFGFLGGLFQLNILLYARTLMGISHLASSILLMLLALGIGIGSVLAGKLSDQKIELGLVPLGAIGLSVFSTTLGFTSHSYISVALCLFMLGISCGFYIVPLNALLQNNSPREQRGQVLATNNFLSFTAILLGSSSIYFFRDILHINAAEVFVVSGIATVFGTGYVCRLLPFSLIRFIVWILTHTLYRMKIVGKNNIPEEGGALLICNHVSYVDAVILLTSTPRPIRFMIHRQIYELKLLNSLFRLAKAIPLSGTDNPKAVIRSLNEAREAIQNGELVCIFAEGQLTRTGNMLKFHKGLERIMKEVVCPVIPIHLDRIWGSIFSFERGKYFFKLPRIFPYPVTVTIGEPIPSYSSAFAVRCRVMELGAESFKYRLAKKVTLTEAFWQEARKHPFQFCVADSTGRSLNYAKTFAVSLALANTLKEKSSEENMVGILLPPSVCAVLTNAAVSIANKIPVNVNYTVSQAACDSIVDQCQMKTMVTSKKFLEKVKLNISCKKVYIEDLMATLNKARFINAFLQAFILPKSIAKRVIFGRETQRRMHHLATIMFTSGSTGEPKGVMLTHANITSNLEGLYQTFHVNKDDMVVGILPFFHSFGFTATLWFPLISGIGAVYHVNPLDAKKIGELVEKYKGTILMSTPTFLNAYLKKCEKKQFASLRNVTVGAERLKESIREAFEEKFGIRPMEGYGCTELSPIVSINLPDYTERGIRQKGQKPGTIGRPLPGVAVKILDQETQEPVDENQDGLLFVKGPNVMKGYLNREDLTKEVIKEGWYMTGDVAKIDDDGFLVITDRVSRFSKIGGEMIPHIKVEETIHNVLKATEQICVVAAVPDEKKGEKLAVLYKGDLDISALVHALKHSDLPNLWIPAEDMFFQIDDIPLLGSGKLDLASIKNKIKEVAKL